MIEYNLFISYLFRLRIAVSKSILYLICSMGNNESLIKSREGSYR